MSKPIKVLAEQLEFGVPEEFQALVKSVNLYKGNRDEIVGTHYNSMDDLIRFYPNQQIARDKCTAGHSHRYRVPYDVGGDKSNRVYVTCKLKAASYEPSSMKNINEGKGALFGFSESDEVKYAVPSISESNILDALKFLLSKKCESSPSEVIKDGAGVSLITSFAEIRRTVKEELGKTMNYVQISDSLQILKGSRLEYAADRYSISKDKGGHREIWDTSGRALIEEIERYVVLKDGETETEARRKRGKLRIYFHRLISSSIQIGDYKHFDLEYRSSLTMLGQFLHRKLLRHFIQARRPSADLGFPPETGEYTADLDQGVAWPKGESQRDSNTIPLFGLDGAYCINSTRLKEEGVTSSSDVTKLAHTMNAQLKALQFREPVEGDEGNEKGIVYAWARVIEREDKPKNKVGPSKVKQYVWYIWASPALEQMQKQNNYSKKLRAIAKAIF